jgi:hypothetical protein
MRKGIQALFVLSLLTTASAQEHPAGGHCELAEPIQLPASSVMGSNPLPPGSPLMIIPNWDATLLASSDEPYDIQSGANVLNLAINGTGIPAIALTVGTMRTAAQIAAELNANSTFRSVADASASNLHNGGGSGAAALFIRSRGAQFGLIEVQIHAQSAHASLGLSIGLTLTAVNAARRAVFEQAFADWESLILAGGNISSPYTARIGYRRAVPFGGLASASPLTSNGVIVGGFLDFDSSEAWFEDPTPANDSEFAGGGGPAGIDLLTIARHELGHALGWVGEPGRLHVATTLTAPIGLFTTTAQVASTADFADSGSLFIDGERIAYSSRTGTQFLGLTRAMNPTAHGFGAPVVREDNDYNITLLNIGVVGRGAHVDPVEHPGDIMRPLFNASERSPISLYPTAARLSLSQGATIPLSVIDVEGSVAPDGRAVAPWPNLTNASANTAPGIPFLLASGIYSEPVLPLTVNQAHEFLVTRAITVLFH